MNRYESMIRFEGFEIIGHEEILGKEMIRAEKMIGDKKISIICDNNGTARIDKPNGTSKWYYEKSYPQIGKILRQVVNFYI